MMFPNANPSEVVFSVAAVIGLTLNIVAVFAAWGRWKQQRLDNINGLHDLFAFSHLRDEIIRVVVMGALTGVALLWLQDEELRTLSYRLVAVRYLLLGVAALLTLKSFFNMGDRRIARKLDIKHNRRKDDHFGDHSI
jgi:hypothetical protein